jgi:transposase
VDGPDDPVADRSAGLACTGHTDIRKGFASLALPVQEVLKRDPLSGHLFCFRGRRGDLLKVIWHDGQGARR